MPLELKNSSQNIVSEFIDEHLRPAIKQAINHPERTGSNIGEIYGLMAGSFEDTPTYITIVDVFSMSPEQTDNPTIITDVNIMTSISYHVAGDNIDAIATWFNKKIPEMIIIKSDKPLVAKNIFYTFATLELSDQVADQLLTQPNYRNEIMASKSGIKDMPLTTTLLADAISNNHPNTYLFELISNLHDANCYIY